MSNRTAYRGGLTAGLAALLFAVLALTNYISARHLHARIDLTENREFTIADGSRRILVGLDDVVNVKVFASGDLPEQVSHVPALIRDLVTELEQFTDDLRVEFIDPGGDPEIEARARSLGIPKAPLMVLEADRQVTVEVYLGIAVLHADAREIIPVVLDNTNLEYELMAAIVRATRPRKTVGFLSGHGERDIYRDYRLVAEALRLQHEVETVSVAGGETIPAEISTLIVAGSREPLDDWTRYQIDQFLMRGGRGLFLIDMVNVDPMQMAVQPAEHGLAEQLASYGVRPLDSLVGDWASNEVVQLPSGDMSSNQPGFYIVEYPLWPKVLGLYMSAEHPVVNRLRTLVLPWTSALQITRDEDDAFTVTELMRSTEFARLETDLMSADPRSLLEPTDDAELGQHLLAAAVTGPLRSAWAGQPAPEPPAPEPEPDDRAGGDERDDGAAADAAAVEELPAPESPPVERRDEVAETQLIVVGGSEFVIDPMLGQQSSENLIFLLNAVDWLTLGEDLVGIRSRAGGAPYLDPARREAGGERVAKIFNIAVVPLLVAVFGVVWRWLRRSRRVVLT